jgi:homoserine O-acetyltransferase
MTTTQKSTNSIDRVETKFFVYGDAGNPVQMGSGPVLPEVALAYETYGTLNEQKDNAILVFHALTGSQHIVGDNPSVPGVDEIWNEECQAGWWNGFVGPGMAFDTNRFFVICANYIGGCYGSTGPSSVNPVSGKRYAGTFPRVTIADIVDSQVALLDHLEIQRIHAATGGSVGGLMCLSLATRYPERVHIVIPIASGLEVTTLQRICNYEQVYAIENDPLFNNGDYYDGPRPGPGVAFARMISHKTFISLETLKNRASKIISQHVNDFSFYQISDPVESYMLHQGKKFTRRFDANTYLRILDAWQTFDLLGDAGTDSYSSLFSRCGDQKYLVFSIDSDVCYYPEEQRALAEELKQAGVPQRRITVHSDKGHDSFLLEPELFTPHLAHALERAW